MAVVAGDLSLTYRELEARSARVARRLAGLGIGAGSRVALLLTRGPALLPALLGTLRAGAAYVPVDPAYPAARVAFLLQDAGVAAVLAEPATRERCQGQGSVPILLAGGGEENGEPQVTPLPVRGVRSADCAYVIYTSGSTGTPKGVMVTHRNAVNFFAGMDRCLAAGPGVWLAATSISFDISVLELLWTLTRGYTVVVADPEPGAGPSLASAMERFKVTHFQCTPSLARMLAESPAEAAALGALDALLVGGEALPPDLADRLLETGVPALHNLYGPTETTVWSSIHRVRPGAVRTAIGRPLANTAIHVLDRDLGLAPVGVAGELYIGGDGVARGYLGRPDLTAGRFVPDALSGRGGARLYRTGDLARWLPAGELEFLGRADHQVKVRGFRVELGEIEAALTRHPRVREAAVVVRRGKGSGEDQLVAWVVPAGEGPPAPSELRAFLRDALPDFMVPGAFGTLAVLPLTPNGKLDRLALALRALESAGERAGFAAPRTPLEQGLAAIWSDLLEVTEVGIHDDFFALGGHSLVATRAMARIRATFGVELPLRLLFEQPTVAGLGAVLASLLRVTDSRSEALRQPIRPLPRPADGALPVSFAQRRLWVLERLFPGTTLYNLSWPLRVTGELAPAGLAWALAEAVRRHEALRTTFAEREGEPVQVIGRPQPPALPRVDLSALPPAARGAELDRLLAAEGARPFDLAAGPLLRALLVHATGSDEADAGDVLLLVAHHIVADGWSMEVLTRELCALCAAAQDSPAGPPSSPLPELPIQYADFAGWQRRHLAGEPLAAQLAYWWQRLAAAPTVLELPADRPRPPVPSGRGASRTFTLPDAVAAELRAACRREGVTPFMLLLAAFDVLLGRLAGVEDLLVGTPVAGRGRVELEGLVGFFVNLLVLRADLAGDPPFRLLLRQIRETTLAAYAHQDLPFEMLVEELHPRRHLSRSPLVQVVFALHPRPGVAQQGGVRFEAVPAAAGAAKFDLSLYMLDGGRGMSGGMEYNPDLFDAATVDRLLAGFTLLVAAVVAEPGRRLSQLPALPFEELPAGLRRIPSTPEPRSGAVGFVAPRNPVEARLAAIWSEVLRVEPVGVEDNFFELGGDSILAIRVASRAQEAGLDVQPRQLFSLETLGALAAATGRTLPDEDARGPAGGDRYPLSPMQEGMLAQALRNTAADPYLNQFAFFLEEPVDLPAFQRAFAMAVERHAILRTAFVWQGLERPLQMVQPAASLPWRDEDWRGVPPMAAEERLAAWLEADHARGCALDRPPLMRCATMRLDAGLYFVWSVHHLLLDAWSVSLLLGEVFALYTGLRAGAAPVLPPAPEYHEFIAWLERQDRAASEAFWRRVLEGFEGPATIALGRPGPPDPGGERLLASREVTLASDRTWRLRELCRRERVTLGTLVQGAWVVLLAVYCGREDVAFGAVTAGRPADLPGSGAMLGLFINTLLVRCSVPSDGILAPWLRDLQEQLAAARQYEFTPLAQVYRWSGVPAGAQLFESIVSVENQELSQALGPVRAGLPGLRQLHARHGSDYPLSLAVTEGDELSMVAQYEARRFAGAAVERLLGHLTSLLADMTADPRRRLCELSLISPAERRQLVEWSGGAAPGRGTVPELLAEVARRGPEAAAVVTGGGTVSHGELDRRAARLAGHLRTLGVGPEERVGLCVERTADLAVGLLGIWKAGGAYVPLDAALPEGRLQSILGGAAIRRVVTVRALAGRLPLHGELAVCLDEAPWREAAAGAPVEVAPKSLAYVIYTSGSTGEPKGVAVSHAALASFVRQAVCRFGLGPDDRVLQFSPLSFNVLLEELVPVWLAGGAVVLEGEVDRLGPAELGDLIAARQVTGLELPAGYWHEWVEALELAEERPPASLRFVILGCEKPNPRRVESWSAWGVPLINVFGLTETTVTSTLYRTDEGPPGRADLPIGRPLDNARVYLLDGRGQPVPVGLPGELYIGGPGVSRGYLEQPGLTAEQFVPDGLSGDPGARLYRTGDLARFAADGTLEFLGRRDHQVKVRGFRVELAEIESALHTHPAIGQAVAKAFGGGASGARLAAYVMPRAGAGNPPSVRELRSFLSGVLPEYMVPAALVVLAELPRTATGKVDRQALPEPEWGRLEEAGGAEPRTPREALLAEIWAQVLGVERVGSEDSFFELGGDSILSIQVVSRALRAGLKLTPWDVFQHPTLAELATVAREVTAEARPKQRAADGLVPLTPVQRWFFARLPERPEHWNLPVFLRVGRRLEAAPLGRALAALVEHHDALRLRYRREGDSWLQLHGRAGEGWPLLEVDLGALPAAAARGELRALG